MCYDSTFHVKVRETLPRTLGRYELVLPIAGGGMGMVYLGRSSGAHGFNREVAIKIVRPDKEAALSADLVREARIAGLIRHPNVVPVLDVGDQDGEVYLVMEFVEGDSLHGLMRAASASNLVLPLEVGLRVLLDGLAGLHAAHELRGDKGEPLGLVHRDFSPQNLLVGVDGSSRLTDFGIAKLADADRHTTTGTVKGKFSYLSPEQARSEPLDRRSDVWAAAVVTWEVLTGQRLFSAGNDARTLLAIVQEDAPDPREAQPDVPAALATAVMAGLTRNLKQRCPTAAAFADRLREAARASDLEIATNEDVAETLRNLVGGKLVARQKAFREALAGKSEAAGESALSAPPAASTPSARASEADTAIHPPAVELLQIAQAAPAEQAALAVSMSSPATGKHAIAAPSFRRARIGIIGVAAGVAIALTSYAFLRADGSSAGPASIAMSSSPPIVSSPPPAPSSDVSPAASAVVARIETSATLPAASVSATAVAKPSVLKRPTPTAKVKCQDWGRCR